MKLVIFTDLDGTLLDDSFSFGPALPALETLRAKQIPCLICSSKTRSEIEYYRIRLSNKEPFIVENGGAIYIPRGYFRHVAAASGYISSTPHEYTTISFGERYQNVRKELLRLRANGFSLKGFGDMTAAEISERTGLSQKEAELAKQREYDEPFVFGGDEKEFQSFVELVHQDGFFCLEGNIFHHLVGRNDKGKAVSLVIDLYRHEFGEITTAGLGDGPNDVPMLQAVDHPVVIQRADGSIAPKIKAFGFPKVGGPGPIGWNKAVLDLVANLGL